MSTAMVSEQFEVEPQRFEDAKITPARLLSVGFRQVALPPLKDGQFLRGDVSITFRSDGTAEAYIGGEAVAVATMQEVRELLR